VFQNEEGKVRKESFGRIIILLIIEILSFMKNGTFQEFSMWKLRKIRVLLMAFYLYLSLLFEQSSVKYIAQKENSVICETF